MLDDAVPIALVNSSWCWIGMYRAKVFYVPYHLLHSELGIAERVDDKNQLSTFSLEQIRQQLNQEILMDVDGKNGK